MVPVHSVSGESEYDGVYNGEHSSVCTVGRFLKYFFTSFFVYTAHGVNIISMVSVSRKPHIHWGHLCGVFQVFYCDGSREYGNGVGAHGLLPPL